MAVFDELNVFFENNGYISEFCSCKVVAALFLQFFCEVFDIVRSMRIFHQLGNSIGQALTHAGELRGIVENGQPGGTIAEDSLNDHCPAAPLVRVVLHYLREGRWETVPMSVDPAITVKENGNRDRRARAALAGGSARSELRYFFVAHALNGLVRHAPLTAPLEAYLARR